MSPVQPENRGEQADNNRNTHNRRDHVNHITLIQYEKKNWFKKGGALQGADPAFQTVISGINALIWTYYTLGGTRHLLV